MKAAEYHTGNAVWRQNQDLNPGLNHYTILLALSQFIGEKKKTDEENFSNFKFFPIVFFKTLVRHHLFANKF